MAKIKPPKKSREQLITEIEQLLSARKRGDAQRELMSYFTTVDLDMIASNLEKGINNDLAV